MAELILASTSVYRRALLERLRLPFRCMPSEVDETPLPGEMPVDRAMRLALAKASEVAARLPGAALVIGSDQVASLDGMLLRKPGTAARAIEQLRASSGRTVEFHTAASLVRVPDGAAEHLLDHTRVRFRQLRLAEIERYVELEQPFDCAGSFKSEGLGISLFEAVESSDPSALVGLPLIGLTRLMRGFGLALP